MSKIHNELEVSLISSFSAKGFHQAREYWPKSVSNVELYTFMQSDLRSMFPDSGLVDIADRSNALHIMAENHNNPEMHKSVADKIQQQWRGFKIVAFATFLPEILAPIKHESTWKAAQKALCFLIALARELRFRGHPISTIELVGGSRTDGLWVGKGADGTKLYVVNRIVPIDAINRLLERLVPVATCAAEDVPIYLALELEPGPLFAIGNKDALKDICSSIETSKNEAIQRTVGLNLDIPHWDFLCQIDVEWLRKEENRIILERVVHAHVCDHSKGHFTDHTITAFHPLEHFEKWIQLLKELSARPKRTDTVNYSGYISCEMEACKAKNFIQPAINHLSKLVERH